MASRINTYVWMIPLGFFLSGIQLKLSAQIPVAVEFGEPTRECLGRGQICTVEIRDMEVDMVSSRGVEGFLEIIPGGWEIRFLSTKAANSSLLESLPEGYCDLPDALIITSQIAHEAKANLTDVKLPPGRYKLIEERGSYILRF